MEKMFSIPISRRDFMKMTGLAAAGVLAVNTVGMPETVLAAPAGGDTVRSSMQVRKSRCCILWMCA